MITWHNFDFRFNAHLALGQERELIPIISLEGWIFIPKELFIP